MDLLKKILEGAFKKEIPNSKKIEIRYLVTPSEIIEKNGKTLLRLFRTKLEGEAHNQKAITTDEMVDEIEFDLLIKVRQSQIF